MATIDDYLDLAGDIHGSRNRSLKKAEDRPDITFWSCEKFEWATWYGDGFQGGIFIDPGRTEIVCAFAGSNLKMGNDLTADLRVLVKLMPCQAGNAYRLAMQAQQIGNGLPITVVGHSLGGALAQIVGYWTGFPFISFNGPGMKGALSFSRFNVFKPQQMYRSVRSDAGSTGIAFRIRGDVIGGFGTPLGRDWVLAPHGPAGRFANHGTGTVRQALRDAGIDQKTFDDLHFGDWVGG